MRNKEPYLACVICHMPWPHQDNGHRASCSHALLIVQWREVDSYMDVTDLKLDAGGRGHYDRADAVNMMREAGIELRSLPGRPDRLWGPAWAAQVCMTIGFRANKRDRRVQFIKAVNDSDTLRKAAEAVAQAGESVLGVLLQAVMP